MKKFAFYTILAIILIGVLFYFFGEHGLIGGLLGSGALGIDSGLRKLKEQGEAYDKEAEEKTKEIRELQEERENLEVKDLTPEEEKEYWKDV